MTGETTIWGTLFIVSSILISLLILYESIYGLYFYIKSFIKMSIALNKFKKFMREDKFLEETLRFIETNDDKKYSEYLEKTNNELEKIYEYIQKTSKEIEQEKEIVRRRLFLMRPFFN